MKKTRKFLTLFLSILLVFTTVSPALAMDYPQDPIFKAVNATSHSEVIKSPHYKDASLRNNPANALGAPDAVQTAGESKFTSLRMFEGVTYYFNDEENFLNHLICNHSDPDQPDLSLIEVTWGGGWHAEAAKVYLTNVTMADSSMKEELYIGTAYNKSAQAMGLVDANFSTYRTVGNFTYTDIFLPEGVLYAEGVKLVDITADVIATNPGKYNPTNTYKADDDGYDLDALTAWYVMEISMPGMFTVQKMVEGDHGYEAGSEGFNFVAYGEIDGDGSPVGNPVATAVTNAAGLAIFESDDIVINETYYVFEIMNADQSAVYQFGAENVQGYIEVTAVESAEKAEAAEFFNDLIPGSGTLIIGKAMGVHVNYGSVTGGYPEEGTIKPHNARAHQLESAIGGKSSNWFEFNDLLPLASDPVQTFDLVTGDGLTKAGEYTVSYDPGTKMITVTIDPLDALSLVGVPRLSIVNDITAIKKSAPGQQFYPSSGYNWNGDSITIPTTAITQTKGKTTTILVPAVDVTEAGYVYIHLSLEGYVDTYGQTAGTTFAVSVTGPSYPDGETFDVPMNGSIILENLKPGEYTVRETEKGWVATYYVNGGDAVTTASVAVKVIRDGTTTVKMTNEPGEVKSNGALSIQKMVEDGNGYTAGPEGFVFAAYAEIDEAGNPVGEAAGRVETNDEGLAVFKGEFLEIGKTYYVFEEMTDEQALIYMFGAQNGNGYIEVTAVSEEEIGEAEAAAFCNDLLLGSITVTKALEAYEIHQYASNSVTGSDGGETDIRVGQGNNWFLAQKVDIAAILEGEFFVAELVAGSKLVPVGTYTISATEDGGLLVQLCYDEVEPDHVTHVVFGNDYNGQTHQGSSGRPGHYENTTPGGSVTIPAGDVAAMIGEGAGYQPSQYFYLHSGFGAQDIKHDVSAQYADEVFTFVITHSEGVEVQAFTLKNGESFTLNKLGAGQYTVTETTQGWAVTYSVEGGMVTVVSGEDSAITVTNYTEEIIEVV